MTSAATPQRTARPTKFTATGLVACDIDGTLLDTGQPASAGVRAAVDKVRGAGHHVVLATGRSLAGAMPVAAELGLDDVWIVASNGAVTAHLVGDEYEITDLHAFEPEPVVRIAVEAMPGIRVAAEIVGLGYRVNIPFPEGALPGEQREAERLAELWAETTTRLALHGPAAFGLMPVLRAMGLTAIETRTDWVDVTPPRLSKATALEGVREQLGVTPWDTVAIGDSDNDIEMLRWAKHGIAMGHAPAQVIDAANRVTGTIDEDGAAAALLSLLR